MSFDDEHFVDPSTSVTPKGHRCQHCLPTISEHATFTPILDPLVEQPFDTTYTRIYKTSAVTPDSLDCDKALRQTHLRHHPVHPVQQLEYELWATQLGFCGEWQLYALPGCASGIPNPNQFDYHPFRFFDHNE